MADYRDKGCFYDNLRQKVSEIKQKIEYDLDYRKSTLEEKGRMLLTFIWYVQDTITVTSLEEIIDRAEFIKSLYKFGKFQRKKFYTEFSDQTYRFEFYKIIKAIEKEEELDSKTKALLICLIEKHREDNVAFISKVLDKLERKIKLTEGEIRYIWSVIEKSHSSERFNREKLVYILNVDDNYVDSERQKIYELIKRYKDEADTFSEELVRKIKVQNRLDKATGKEATDIVKKYYTYSDTIHRKIPIELQNVKSILSNIQAVPYSRAELQNEVHMLTRCCITDGCETSLPEDGAEQVENYKKLIEEYKKNVMNNMVTSLFNQECSDNNQLPSWTGNEDSLDIAKIFDEMYNQIERLINRETAREETYKKLNKIVEGKYKVVDRYDDFLKITGELLYVKNIFNRNGKKLKINNLNLAGLIYFVLRMVKYESMKKYENFYSNNLDRAEGLKHDKVAILLSTMMWMHNFNYFEVFKSIDFFIEGKLKEETLNISSKIVEKLVRDIEQCYNKAIPNNDEEWLKDPNDKEKCLQDPWEKQRKSYKECAVKYYKILKERNLIPQKDFVALVEKSNKKVVIEAKVSSCCLTINEYIDDIENLDEWVRNANELLDAKTKLDEVRDNLIEKYKCLLASKDKKAVTRSMENIKKIHKKVDNILKMIDEM